MSAYILNHLKIILFWFAAFLTAIAIVGLFILFPPPTSPYKSFPILDRGRNRVD
jgi:hypothetical protein